MLAIAGTAGPVQAECAAPKLPVEFPIDVVLFRGEVIEPAVEISAGGGLWGLEVEVRAPVHVLAPDRRFRIVLTGAGCRPLDRQALIERFVATDQLEVAAFVAPGDAVLEAPETWVALHDRNATRGIETVLEYFEALLRLARAENDRERVPVLSAIGWFVHDASLYEQLLRAHLESRSMRKSLRRVHASRWHSVAGSADGV